MVLTDDTDWDEVAELMIESYCVLAPKKLIALVDRPPTDDATAAEDADDPFASGFPRTGPRKS
jgi:hypothetical protein